MSSLQLGEQKSQNIPFDTFCVDLPNFIGRYENYLGETLRKEKLIVK